MSSFRDVLLLKNGKVILALAREFLLSSAGDRISTVENYAYRFGTGRGTVQSALKFLQKVGAVALESRGHLGTFIINIDYKILWDAADFGTIMAVMPLPYSARYEGLATGLSKAFASAGLPFSLAFMRGASVRINALLKGKYNFAVMSKLAARLETEKGTPIAVLHEFAPYTYVQDHVVIFRDPRAAKIKAGMRVALDPASVDQMILTCYECQGIEVQYVETPYTQIPQKLRSDQLDAAVWNMDEVKEKNMSLNIRPLSREKSRAAASDDTVAVLVAQKEDSISEFLRRHLDFASIQEVQAQVVNRQLIPAY